MKKPHSEARRTASSYALMPLVLLVGGLAFVGAMLFQGLARVGRRLIGRERIAVIIATTLVVFALIKGGPNMALLASVLFWALIASLVLVRLEDRQTKFRPASVKKTK